MEKIENISAKILEQDLKLLYAIDGLFLVAFNILCKGYENLVYIYFGSNHCI